MAKPVIGVTLWATDAVFTTGPAALLGTATKITPPAALSDEGWPADFKPGAQHWNFLWNQYSTWLDWLRLGSSAAGLDDHVVETDTIGDAAIARLVLGGTANGAGALAATSNAAGAAGTFTDTIGSFAVVASANGTLAAVRGTNTGTGPGVQGLALGTDNVGGDFDGTGTGAGATCNGGSGGGSGVIATGGGVGLGVIGIGGSGGGAGGDFTAGTLAADGLVGRTTGAAARTIAAVVALPTGDAAGVRISTTNGAHFNLVGLAADPSAPGNGDLWFESTADEMRMTKGGLLHVMQANRAGIEHTLATAGANSNTSGGPVTAVSQAITPTNPANVLVTVTANVDFSADTASATVDIFDSVAAGTVDSVTIKSKAINTAGGRGETVTMRAIVAVSTAARTLSMRFTSVAGNVSWTNPIITIESLN